MAGAHLTAIGLPELITYNLKDYEEVAVSLSQDPERCKTIRSKIEEAKLHGAAFNTEKFVKELESRLIPIYQETLTDD
jgi:predicted O-linked N-acetylglucosamine transferase (SPINDLY family)